MLSIESDNQVNSTRLYFYGQQRESEKRYIVLVVELNYADVIFNNQGPNKWYT